MPLYKPELSPRVHPYGALKDITPEGMEDLFISSKGGPSVPPFNYRFTVRGRYRLQAWFGRTGFPRTLHLFVSDDGGETWERKDHTFPPLMLTNADDCLIEAAYESNVLYLQAPTEAPGGPEHISIEVYRSDDNGSSWDHENSLAYPGYSFIGHRAFIWGQDLYQAACIFSDAGPPFESRVVGWKNGELILDVPTTSQNMVNGGLTASVNSYAYETAFFAIEFNSFLGGQEIWRVSNSGIEFRGKVPETPFSIPPGPTRPFLLQLWYLPKKGILYAPTQTGPGHRLYTSFDEGLTWEEAPGGIRIAIPALNTINQAGIFEDPVTGERYKNFEFMQNLTGSTNWTEILESYAGDDEFEWHIGFQSRLFRRGSKFYLWELIVP